MQTRCRLRFPVATLVFSILVLLVGLTSGIVDAETHEVRAGETLLDIGVAHGIDPDLIARFNNISSPSNLWVGQELLIPDLSGTQVDVSASVVYVVEPWGILSGVITPFGVSPGSVLATADINRSESETETERPVIVIRDYLSRPTGSRRTFLCPAFGQITTYFGERGSSWRSGVHEGLDIGARFGTIVRAADNGVVVEDKSDDSRGYGSFVKLDHGDGVHTLYAHLSRVYVKPGERVNGGQVIGLVGSSGFSDGPHLHFELRIAGEKVDPLPYLH